MSYGDNQNPFRHDLPSVPPPSSGNGVLKVLAIVGGILLLCGLICGVTGFFFVRSVSPPTPPEIVKSLQQSPAERQAELVAEFQPREIQVEATDLAQIRSLFKQLSDEARTTDPGMFEDSEAFDKERFAKAVCGYQESQNLNFMERLMISAEAEGYLSNDSSWSHCQLAQIKLSDDGSQAVAYVYAADVDRDYSSFRFWLARQDNGWKIWDFENVDFGIRRSREVANLSGSYARYSARQYARIFELIEAADTAAQGNDRQAIANELRRAEQCLPPQALRDSSLLSIAYAWNRNGFQKECLALAQKISPQKSPGAVYIQILAQSRNRQRREILDKLDEYEKLIGRSPRIDLLRGQTLGRLKRKREATAALQNVLRVDPNHHEALREFGSLAAPDQATTFRDLVLNTDDPLETAATMNNSLRYFNPPLADVMVTLLREKEPQATRTLLAEVMTLKANEDFSAAAELLQKAIANANVAERERLVATYIQVLAADGKFMEGFAAWPDKKPFMDFVWAIEEYEEEELSAKEAKEFLQAYREIHPDDPRVFAMTGEQSIAAGKFAEAETAFRFGLKQLTALSLTAMHQTESYKSDLAETVKPRLDFGLQRSLAEQGQTVVAYEMSDEPVTTFQILANLLRTKKKFDELSQLVAKHREKQPEDPALFLYEAACQTHRGELAAARESLLRGHELMAGQPYYQNHCLREFLMQSDKDGDFWNSTERLAKTPQVCLAIGYYLESQSDWVNLLECSNRFFRLLANESSGNRLKTTALWNLKDYDALIPFLEPIVAEGDPDQFYYFLESRVAPLFRAYVRTNRIEQAERTAATLYQEHNMIWPSLFISAYKQDVAETTHWLQKHLNNQERIRWGPDEDLHDFLMSPAFLEIRREHPPSLYDFSQGSEWILLLNSPQSLNHEQLQQKIREVVPDAKFTALPVSALPSVNGWLIQSDSAKTDLVLTFGTDPFRTNTAVQDDALDKPEPALVQKQKAWLSLATRQPQRADPLLKLAKIIAPEGCVAIYDANLNRLHDVEKNNVWDSLLRNTSNINDQNDFVDLVREANDEENERAELRASSQRRREFTMAFRSRGPSDQFRIRIRLTLGQASEDLWLRVTKWKEPGEYGHSYIGEALSNSILFPGLSGGEPLSISESEMLEWQPMPTTVPAE